MMAAPPRATRTVAERVAITAVIVDALEQARARFWEDCESVTKAQASLADRGLELILVGDTLFAVHALSGEARPLAGADAPRALWPRIRARLRDDAARAELRARAIVTDPRLADADEIVMCWSCPAPVRGGPDAPMHARCDACRAVVERREEGGKAKVRAYLEAVWAGIEPPREAMPPPMSRARATPKQHT